MNEKKLILYISMSLDGYLATHDDDISWLSIVEREGVDYGYSEFVKTVDTYIVGSKTYETVLKLTGGTFPAAETLRCYVITRQARKEENGIVFYNGGLAELIAELKKEGGKNIFCDGGAMLVKMLMEQNLIDEYIISIIPIILGDGKRLFKGGIPGIGIEAVSSKQFESGLIQVHYKRK